MGGRISKKYEFTHFDEIINQLYRWDHKYFYQVMHSDQEADAAESVSPTTSDLFGNGGVSEGDESVVGDQIVPYVAPISSEEKKKKPMRKGQRLDWEPVDLLKIRVGLREDATAYVEKENLGTLPLSSSTLGRPAVALIAQCGRCKDFRFGGLFKFVFVQNVAIVLFVCLCVCTTYVC